MNVYIVFQEYPSHHPIISGVFTNMQDAKACADAAKKVGVRRWIEITGVLTKYDAFDDYLLQEEEETL